jgi:sugar lactone lactonase YvrE
MTAASTTTVFWPGRASLGEGPLWDPRIDTLYWVDIVAGALFAQAADAHEPTRIDVGAQLGCLGLTDDPRLLVAGMRTGWHLLDTRTSGLTFLADPEADRPACRFNDGSVDPAGRFWTGSLEDGEAEPLGRLYRLDGAGYTTVDEGFFCANGIDWSPDGRWMYFVDSRADVIYRYAFDLESGAVGDRKGLRRHLVADGHPRRTPRRQRRRRLVRLLGRRPGDPVQPGRQRGRPGTGAGTAPDERRLRRPRPPHHVHHLGVHRPHRGPAGPMAAVGFRSAI